jgi:hypothetical protein
MEQPIKILVTEFGIEWRTGTHGFNKEHILAIVMGSTEVPVLEAILPSYIVVLNTPFCYDSFLLLIFPHQSHNTVTVVGVKLVDRSSWKHTAGRTHHLSGEGGSHCVASREITNKKWKYTPSTCGECHRFFLPVEQTGVANKCHGREVCL